jgi:hypothetical protein
LYFLEKICFLFVDFFVEFIFYFLFLHYTYNTLHTFLAGRCQSLLISITKHCHSVHSNTLFACVTIILSLNNLVVNKYIIFKRSSFQNRNYILHQLKSGFQQIFNHIYNIQYNALQ